MATSSTLESQLTLITRGLTGLDGVPAIRGMLSEEKTPKCIWSEFLYIQCLVAKLTSHSVTAPTGKRKEFKNIKHIVVRNPY